MAIRAAAYTVGGVDLHKFFTYLDKDHTGRLDFTEFSRGVRRGRIAKERTSDEALAWLFNLIDTDNSGTIEVNEFVNFVGNDNTFAAHGTPRGSRKMSRRGHSALAIHGNPHDKRATEDPQKSPVKGISSVELEEVKRKLRAAAYTTGGINLRKFFAYADKDKGGDLDLEEFVGAVRHGRISKNAISDKQLGCLFRAIDKNGGGTIEVEELIDWIGIEHDTAHPSVHVHAKPRRPSPHRLDNGQQRDAEEKVAKVVLSSEEMNDLKRKIKANAYRGVGGRGGVQLEKYFELVDRDRGGGIDEVEFMRAMRRARLTKQRMSDEQLQFIFNLIDTDRSGSIQVSEFVAFVNGENSYDPESVADELRNELLLKSRLEHVLHSHEHAPKELKGWKQKIQRDFFGT